MSIERLGEIGFVSAETIQADVDRFNEAIRDGRMQAFRGEFERSGFNDLHRIHRLSFEDELAMDWRYENYGEN